jgi:hypothetical protein
MLPRSTPQGVSGGVRYGRRRGPVRHDIYSAAKFAVKGYTEALMRINAPHIKMLGRH